MKEMPKPVACTIDLTEACNLRCDYCFTWSKHKPRVISDEMAFRIVDWWLPQTAPNMDGNQQAVELSFWGGEPLLQWEKLKRIRNYGKRKADEIGRNIVFGGTTNGVLYTPDKVEWCAQNQSLFLVSVDGLQKQHDTHRRRSTGGGSWATVIANLKEALKIAPNIHVRMSLVPEFMQDFLESIQFLHEEIGVHHIAFSPVMESDWTPESLDILREQFVQAAKYYAGRLKEGHELNLKHFADEAMMQGKNIQNPCGAGNGYMGWSVDGFCFPCHRFNKHGITTEQRSKLPTIIARPVGDSFEWVNHEWRRQFVEFKENPSEQCQGCDLFGFSSCNGGCYAVAYDFHGELHKPPKFECEYNKVQNDTAKLLRQIAEENGLNLSPFGQAENQKPAGNGCICFNMCYNEGTPEEIINIDRKANFGCLCNQAQYNGEAVPTRTRNLLQIDTQVKLRKRFIDLSIRILETPHEGKSEKQLHMESDVLKKTAELLKGESIF